MLSLRGIGPEPYPDVSKIPTPPLQRVGIFIIFFFPAMSTIVIALRFYTRVTMRTLGLDRRYIGVFEFVYVYVRNANGIHALQIFKLNYYGWEDDQVPEYNPSPGLWWNFFEQLCYNPVLALVKCSVLVFLLRLRGNKKIIFRVIWGLIIANILHAVAIFFAALFQCIDNSFHIIQSSLTILMDVMVLVLPFWIFLGLRMPRGAKVAVLGVFAIGAFVPIVAIIRLVNIYRLLYLNEKTRHHNIAYVWTPVEVNLALISCSMPALRPLFSRWYPKVFGRMSDKSSEQPYGSKHGVFSNATYGGHGTEKSHNNHSHSINYMLNNLHPSRKRAHTEIRGVSPTGSEEEIMTHNGILRTTNVDVMYQDAKRSETGSSVSNETVAEGLHV
ncbi:Fc.00g055780.m01.CDS01 [Cosmosporella sp. VM-42]